MSTIVTATALGKHLGVSRQRVSALAAIGVLKQLADGRFDQDVGRLAYIAWLRCEKSDRTKAAAVSRVQDARAREIDLRVAEKEGRLVDVSRAAAIIDDVVGIYRTGIGSLPARATRDLPLRRLIEAECDAIQREVSKALADRIEGLKAGTATLGGRA